MKKSVALLCYVQPINGIPDLIGPLSSESPLPTIAVKCIGHTGSEMEPLPTQHLSFHHELRN